MTDAPPPAPPPDAARAPGTAALPPRAVVLAVAGATLSALIGFAAGLLSTKPVGRFVAARLLHVAPGPAAVTESPAPAVGGTPLGRLAALDERIGRAAPGDASVVPHRLARARLLMIEGHSPTLAQQDLDAALAFPSCDEAAEATFTRALALAESGAASGALGEARRFLRLFPRSWRAAEMALLGAEILEATGRLTEAVALLEDALARDPRHADRPHRDPGDRGRYPPRMEPLLLALGELYLRAGDYGSAEAAFALVARPEAGPDDFGETWQVSPRVGRAVLGLDESVWRARDRRAPEARARLERIADDATDPRARRARLALDGAGASDADGAWALAERGRLDEAARAARDDPPGSAAAAAMAGIALRRAAWDPHGALALADVLGALGLPGASAREDVALARARALESLGRLDEAAAALCARGPGGTGRLAAALADFARRHAGVVDRSALDEARVGVDAFLAAVMGRGTGR